MLTMEVEKKKKNLALRWVFGFLALIACWVLVSAGMFIILEGSIVQEISGLIGLLIGIGALIFIVRS
jgi:hypothetical protein